MFVLRKSKLFSYMFICIIKEHNLINNKIKLLNDVISGNTINVAINARK